MKLKRTCFITSSAPQMRITMRLVHHLRRKTKHPTTGLELKYRNLTTLKTIFNKQLNRVGRWKNRLIFDKQTRLRNKGYHLRETDQNLAARFHIKPNTNRQQWWQSIRQLVKQRLFLLKYLYEAQKLKVKGKCELKKLTDLMHGQTYSKRAATLKYEQSSRRWLMVVPVELPSPIDQKLHS